MKMNVLLVDDDSVVLMLQKNLIERSTLPSPAQSFNNGREALNFIENSKSHGIPYLVLLDINMPVVNGWDFLKSIQKLDVKDDIFVAMATSSINSGDIKASKAYPQVIDYIQKPVTLNALNALQEKVQELCAY